MAADDAVGGDVAYSWGGTTLLLVRKDANLGVYGWNVQQLVDAQSRAVVWDAKTEGRAALEAILATSRRIESPRVKHSPTPASDNAGADLPFTTGEIAGGGTGTAPRTPTVASDASSVAESTPETPEPHQGGDFALDLLGSFCNGEAGANGGEPWKVWVDEEGKLHRTGAVGDQVAWVIEFEGQRVLTKHAANHLTYRYSGSLEHTAFLVDSQTFSLPQSNHVTVSPNGSPAARLAKTLTPPSGLRIAREDRLPNQGSGIVPKLATEHGQNGLFAVADVVPEMVPDMIVPKLSTEHGQNSLFAVQEVVQEMEASAQSSSLTEYTGASGGEEEGCAAAGSGVPEVVPEVVHEVVQEEEASAQCSSLTEYAGGEGGEDDSCATGFVVQEGGASAQSSSLTEYAGGEGGEDDSCAAGGEAPQVCPQAPTL
ncbi:hypothetical protein T484DRAFT_1774039 [Baffinella frigidus]|nr:hypothetical protein T484DRAFT_1774039 [Cryptophyta sp. CCMP2293]